MLSNISLAHWKSISKWRHTDEDGFEMWETTEDPNKFAIIENDDKYDLYALQGEFDSPEEAKDASAYGVEPGGIDLTWSSEHPKPKQKAIRFFPESKTAADEREYMYHITRASNLKSILKDGLKTIPNDTETNGWMFPEYADFYSHIYKPNRPIFLAESPWKKESWNIKIPKNHPTQSWIDADKAVLKVDVTGLRKYPDFGSLTGMGAYLDENKSIWFEDHEWPEAFDRHKAKGEISYRTLLSQRGTEEAYRATGTAAFLDDISPDRISVVKPKKTAYQAEDLDEKEDPRIRVQDPEPWADVAQPSMADGKPLIVPAIPVVRKRRGEPMGGGGYPGGGWSIRPTNQSPDDLAAPDALGQVTGAADGLNDWWRTAIRLLENKEITGHNIEVKVQNVGRERKIFVYHRPCDCGNKNQMAQVTPHHLPKKKEGNPAAVRDWINRLGIPREVFQTNDWLQLLGKPIKKKDQETEPEEVKVEETEDAIEHLQREHGWDKDGSEWSVDYLNDQDDAINTHASMYPRCNIKVGAQRYMKDKDLEDWTETIGPVAYHDPALTSSFWTSGDQEANTEHKKRIPAILRKGLLSGTSMKQGWMGGRPNHSYLAVPNGRFGPYVEKFPLVVDLTKLNTENIHADEDALGFVHMDRDDYMYHALSKGFESVGHYADSIIKDTEKDINKSLTYGSFAYNNDIANNTIKINPAWVRENQKTIDKWGKKDDFWNSGYKKFLYKGECFGCDGTGSTTCYDCKGIGTNVCSSCDGKTKRCYDCKGTKKCGECRGTGKDRDDKSEDCYQCYGDKKCTSCENDDLESTGRTCGGSLNICNGTGRETCPECAEMGTRQCRVCEGAKTLGRKKRKGASLDKIALGNWKRVVLSDEVSEKPIPRRVQWYMNEQGEHEVMFNDGNTKSARFISPTDALTHQVVAQDGGGGGAGGGGGGGASGGGGAGGSGGGASGGASGGGDGSGGSTGDSGASGGESTGDGSSTDSSGSGTTPTEPSEPKPSFGPDRNTTGGMHCPRCQEQCYSIGTNYYSCMFCGWAGYSYPRRKKHKREVL